VTNLFDGLTYDTEKDEVRLTTLFDKVLELMLDGHWRTLNEIAFQVGGQVQSVSARLRDARKPKFGGYQVERKRVGGGLWIYRILDPIPEDQQTLEV
tara:strand:+ start:756 stop:1046 length:291 start_codon:yes stop_codon:yes gene_type:complete